MPGQWPVNRPETCGANTGDMSEPEWAPLTGFRVAVTSARRADELSALLRKRGASVTSAAAIEMVPLPDDRRAARPHRSADRRAPRHRDRYHRHRLPRLGRRRRRLGTGQRSDRLAGQGPHRVPRPEGDRRVARRGSAGGMVAGVRVVPRAAALPRRGRYFRSAHRRPVARRHRGMGSVPRVSRRAARRGRRRGADPGLPMASGAPKR